MQTAHISPRSTFPRRSLFALAIVAAAPALFSLVACGSDSSTSGSAPSATTSATATASATGTSTTAAVTRKLVAGPLLPSSPGNLLLDPSFGLLSSQDAAYGTFQGTYSDDGSQFIPQTTLDSRSPAGFSGNVAVLLTAMATDTKSRNFTLLTSVLGGTGSYHASIWVSKSNVAGQPIDFSPADKQISVELTTDVDSGPAGASAKVYPLVADPTPQVASNGRSWTHYQVDVTDPLPNGAFMLIGVGNKGGAFQLAAPEVTSSALEKQLSNMSLVKTQSRAMTDEERAAIRRYKATPPKFRQPEVRKIRGE
jgi:hypothetical protein